MPRCSACQVTTPVLDSHHVVPLCYGGREDGLQVSICGTCHKAVHHYERNTLQPPRYLLKLVVMVRTAKAAFEQGRTVAEDSRRQVQVKLSPEDEALLDALALRFNTRGRPATLSAVIRYAARAAGVTN